MEEPTKVKCTEKRQTRHAFKGQLHADIGINVRDDSTELPTCQFAMATASARGLLGWPTHRFFQRLWIREAESDISDIRCEEIHHIVSGTHCWINPQQ
jgi:hypothetical protein